MKNNIIFGFIASALATVAGICLVYVLKFLPHNIEFSEFTKMLFTEPLIKSGVLSLGLLANIPLYYYCHQRKIYNTLKGIALVIIIMAVYIVLSKFHII
jgi:ABC-type Fe3+ transport system permease subunit